MNDREISGDIPYAWMKELCFCRETGTEGEHTAAVRIAEQIRRNGAVPVTESFSFPAETWIRASLVIQGESYPVTGVSGTCLPGRMFHRRAPVCYAENGDAVSLRNVTGKIVLLNGPVTPSLAENAKEAGAAAFLWICGSPLDTGTDRIPAHRSVRAQGILPGACIHYLDALHILQNGSEPEGGLFLETRKTEVSSQNIRARITGTGRPDEILTLTAHYDSVAEGPGAYDNLASCAILTELLRYFTSRKPVRTLEFIWFGAEEKGLQGSRAYMEQHENELGSHLFNMNSDLAGQRIGGDVIGVTAQKEVCDILDGILAEAQLGVTLKNQVWSSDSNTFAWKGIPAMTYDRDGFGMHTGHDTMEWISPEALRRGALVIGTIAEKLADVEPFPFGRNIPAGMAEKLKEYFKSDDVRK
jgi:aminopeptidase YwaD